MNVAIYNQHFASMGGGERRSAQLAAHLAKTHRVALFTEIEIAERQVIEAFGIDLSGVKVVPLQGKDHLTEIEAFRPDVFINNSYGSTLPSVAPVGIYMCMFPEFHPPDFATYGVVTANSQYTSDWILRKWGCQSEVVYSACQDMGPGAPKQNVILNVGRFFEDITVAHHKKQHVLVEAFRRLVDGGLADWELYLLGRVGYSDGDRAYFADVKALSEGYPIRIFENLDFEHLRDAYRKASVYWHATGYGLTADDLPSKHEHFGMAIVEAMSAGAIPFAIDGGGPPEIITPGRNGFLWTSVDQLVRETQNLLSDNNRMATLSSAAVADSRKFDAEHFLARMDAIIARLTQASP